MERTGREVMMTGAFAGRNVGEVFPVVSAVAKLVCEDRNRKKNVELIIQVNLLQELSQGITRYPTPALSQVWRCEGFHRVLDVLFSNQNCPSRI